MNKLVQEARALCEGATEGPWEYDGMHHEIQCFHGDKFWLVLSELREHPGDKLPTDEFGHVFNADFALIARSRTLLPEMAAEIERLEAELDALKADIEAGRLVRPPYSFGQEVWYTGMRQEKAVDKFSIQSFGLHDDGWTAWIFPDGPYPFSAEVILDGEDSDLGKTLFLTEAEALAAMEEDAHAIDTPHP